jgi:hypothetical protein
MDLLLIIAAIIAYTIAYYTTAKVCLILLTAIYWISLVGKEEPNVVDVTFALGVLISWIFIFFH